MVRKLLPAFCVVLISLQLWSSAQPVDKVEILEVVNVKQDPSKSEAKLVMMQMPEKLRQDGEDAAEGIAEGLSEGVGSQVGNIINGVLTANVGDIFKGTLPFIPDADTQTGIGTIFDSLTKPLNTLWATSNMQVQKYFGFNQTTPNPLGNSTGAVAQGVEATTVGSEDEYETDINKF